MTLPNIIRGLTIITQFDILLRMVFYLCSPQKIQFQPLHCIREIFTSPILVRPSSFGLSGALDNVECVSRDGVDVVEDDPGGADDVGEPSGQCQQHVRQHLFTAVTKS